MILCKALEIYWTRHGVECGIRLILDTLQTLLGTTCYGMAQGLYKNYDLKMFVLVALENGSMRHTVCRFGLHIETGLNTGSSAKLREFKTPLV